MISKSILHPAFDMLLRAHFAKHPPKRTMSPLAIEIAAMKEHRLATLAPGTSGEANYTLPPITKHPTPINPPKEGNFQPCIPDKLCPI